MASFVQQDLYDKVDKSTLSNYTFIIPTNIRLEWNVDFEKQVFSGSAEQTMKVLVGGTTEANFDSSKLHIDSVTIDGRAAEFNVASPHAVLGSKVSVAVPEDLRSEGSTFVIRFNYSIDPEASAVQWLPPSATKGGKHPYVFTQSQAIHARSLIPCMDSPAVKTSYQAVVTAPSWSTVLMSAVSESTTAGENGISTFVWNQSVPTPAYLIALAAGNLTSRDISDRVRVWSEPEEVDAVHYEFAETEEFLEAAEQITGLPYMWGRYDVLCLPPSFPYGGMENPCLTFATPTLLAGDRSLADVIAHEIAHSWTGNLVTNHSWSHFWLNEGWTVWLERKILSRVKKNDEYGKLSAQIGLIGLIQNIEGMGLDNPFTSLVWPLSEDDPDDAFSRVPYDKGFNLLNYLEYNIVGTEIFADFVKAYLNEFKYSTVTTGEFRDFFVNFIQAHATGDVLAKLGGLDWNELFLSKGQLTYIPDFANSLSASAEILASEWNEAAVDDTFKFESSANDLKGWSSQQVCIFLEELLENDNIPLSILQKLDELYGFGKSGNSEIKFRWQTLCLKHGAAWIVSSAVEFLKAQGRMKFVRPLYRALALSSVGGQIAVTTFEENKHLYHPIARKMIDTDLKKFQSTQA